jgi:tetratricopeptide (TPR) repeat protein
MRVVFATLLLLVVSPASAFADAKADAKQHLERAMAAHKDARYADALTELKIAYTLDPQPALLYAIGQVHVMQGQCDQAITFYQRFIDAKPGPAQVAKADQAIETCKQIEAEKPKQPKEQEPPQLVPSREPPLRVETSTAPWYSDWLGDALVGSGIAAGIVGTLFYRSAISDRDDADTATTYERYDELLARSGDKQRISIGFAAGAGVLVTAGVISYIVRDRKVETRTLIAAPTRQGAVITWFGHF